MNKYELSLIMVSSDKTDEDVKQDFNVLKKHLSETLDGEFEVTNVIHWGRKKFAYPIEKNEYGYYLILSVKTNPAKHLILKKELKLQENVVRYQFLEAKKPMEKPKRDRAKEMQSRRRR